MPNYNLLEQRIAMPKSFGDFNVRRIRAEEVAIITFMAAHADKPVQLPMNIAEISVFVLKDDERSGYIDFVNRNDLKIPFSSRVVCYAQYTDSDGGHVEVLLFTLLNGALLSLEFPKAETTDLVTYPRPEDLRVRAYP